MYLLARFILQSLKKLLEPIQSYEDVPFSGPKWHNLSWTKFLWYKPLILLSSTYWPFSLCKILKNSYDRSRVTRMCHFWAQNGPFAPNKIFWKTINITPTPFIVQNFKKILLADQEVRGCAIFGPKMSHFPKWEFLSENLLMSLPSFIHAYIHAKNQSQILIYWWNIND